MLDKTEFKQLFDHYFDAIRCFIFYRCGDADAASDMAQDVFTKIWEKRQQLHRSHIKSLLYKMANDLVISNYRKDMSRSDFEQSLSATGEHLSPEEEFSFIELSATYAGVLAKMPESQRVVFLMSRNDELKYSEIAECLDISVKAVEKRMSAALHLLRTELL